MFRFWQTNIHQEESKSLLHDHDEENPFIGLFNAELDQAVEGQILSYLTPRDLACFSSVNSHWHNEINQLVLQRKFRKLLFDLITTDARALANMLRQHFSRGRLSTPDTHLFELKNLYRNQRTRMVLEAEPVGPQGEQFLKKWLADFHDAYFLHEDDSLSIMPKHICNWAIIPLFLSILSMVGLHLYDNYEEKRYNDDLDERDQVYQAVDHYLSEHIHHVNAQQDYAEYEKLVAIQKIYSTASYDDPFCSNGDTFPSIDRSGNNPSCQTNPWEKGDFEIINFCYYQNKPVPFSYVENTPELDSLTGRCETLNRNLGVINEHRTRDYYVDQRIPLSETPYGTARNWEWAPLTGFILLLLLWIARSGVFCAISNACTNRAGSKFFSETKNLAKESKNLREWEKKLDQQEQHKNTIKQHLEQEKRKDEKKSFRL